MSDIALDAVNQPFQVGYLTQQRDGLGAGQGIIMEPLKGVLSLNKSGNFEKGLAEPLLQEATAHRGFSKVYNREQRAIYAAGMVTSDKLQVALGLHIQSHK